VDDLVVGDAEVSRRPMAGLPNPDFKGGDYPYVSEEGVSYHFGNVSWSCHTQNACRALAVQRK